MVTVPAPLGRLPLFVRAGALIPLGDAKGISTEREVLVCGVVEGASGELYEDDGETTDWRGEGATLVRFKVRAGELLIQHEGQAQPGLTRIAVRQIGDGGLS